MRSALARLREIRRQSSERPESGGPSSEARAFDYFSSPFADLFRDLTGDIATAADTSAVVWAEQAGWSVFATLVTLDRQAEAFAVHGDEPGFRRTVAQMVELFATVRAAYREAVQ